VLVAALAFVGTGSPEPSTLVGILRPLERKAPVEAFRLEFSIRNAARETVAVIPPHPLFLNYPRTRIGGTGELRLRRIADALPAGLTSFSPLKPGERVATMISWSEEFREVERQVVVCFGVSRSQEFVERGMLFPMQSVVSNRIHLRVTPREVESLGACDCDAKRAPSKRIGRGR